jgi:hypothetical protein
MSLCGPQARSYAICVSQKGINVEQGQCGKEFAKLIICMGRKQRKSGSVFTFK